MRDEEIAKNRIPNVEIKARFSKNFSLGPKFGQNSAIL